MGRYLAILLTAQLGAVSFLAACTAGSSTVDPLGITAAPGDREPLEELSPAGTLGKRQIDLWIGCQRKFALALARNTPEPPEGIIIAAFSACTEKEYLIRATLKKAAVPDADTYMNRVRQASRERLIMEIIAGRNRRDR
ncbi:MAG: hypothetical protein AB7K78_22365 [Xanthobacteraceae bacterium]